MKAEIIKAEKFLCLHILWEYYLATRQIALLVCYIWTIPTKYASCCNDLASPNRPKGEKLQYSST